MAIIHLANGCEACDMPDNALFPFYFVVFCFTLTDTELHFLPSLIIFTQLIIYLGAFAPCIRVDP